MYERISDRQLPNIRNMLKTAALHNSNHVEDEFYQTLSEAVLVEFDLWIDLVREEAVNEFIREHNEFIREHNAEYRKRLERLSIP